METLKNERKQVKCEEVTADNTAKIIELRLKLEGNKTEDELKKEAKKYPKEKNRRAFLSLEEGAATGFVEIKLEEDELPAGAPGDMKIPINFAHLVRIAVDENYRGKRIGKALIQQAEEWAKEQGREGVWLDYLANNTSAGMLYKSCGYEDIGNEFMDAKKKKLRKIAVKYFQKA